MENTSSMTDLDTQPVGKQAEAKASAKANAAKQAEVKAAADVSGEKRYRIIIPSSPTDASAVKVMVNGDMTLIPRNKEVVVKASVLEVLRNAVTTTYNQEGADQESLRYSFSVLGEA